MIGIPTAPAISAARKVASEQPAPSFADQRESAVEGTDCIALRIAIGNAKQKGLLGGGDQGSRDGLSENEIVPKVPGSCCSGVQHHTGDVRGDRMVCKPIVQVVRLDQLPPAASCAQRGNEGITKVPVSECVISYTHGAADVGCSESSRSSAPHAGVIGRQLVQPARIDSSLRAIRLVLASWQVRPNADRSEVRVRAQAGGHTGLCRV
eukprot:2128013-Prymnesium_polylepis.1